MRILIIHRDLPFPADNGGKLRAAHVARYLASEHEVAFLAFGSPSAIEASQSLPERELFWHFECLTAPVPVPLWRRAFSGVPSEVFNLHSPAMVSAIARVDARFDPQVILISDPGMTPYLKSYQHRLLVLDYLMAQPLSLQRLAEISKGWKKLLWRLRWQRAIAFHRQIASCFHLCLVNSVEDFDDLNSHSQRWQRLEFFPNGLNLDDYPLELAQPVRGRLIYPGSVTYLPNRDAVAYMIEQILPRVRRHMPEAELVVTGAVPEDGSAPRSDNVTYTGRVADVRPVIAGAWACVVPLRSGAGGTRFKVLEAMALGTPIVSTSIGAEGVEWTDGQNILISDEPEDFAGHVLRLLKDAELRSALSSAGRRLIAERYDWKVLGCKLTAMLQAMLSTQERRSA